MAKSRWRLATATVAACIALSVLPAAGQAAQVFGSGLFNQPNQPGCQMAPSCTIAAFVELPAEGQVVRNGAPSDGVITKFRIRAKVEMPTPVTFRVANVTPETNPIAATASATATGPSVTLQTTNAEGLPIQEFPARVAVKKGQRLALDGPSNLIASFANSDAKFSYEFAPPLIDGTAPRGSNNFLGELLVQATIEPDADRDGFGDETQDGCPSQASTQGACDLIKPTIGGFRVRKGRISYRLSEPSTVKLRLTKKVGGKFKPLGRPFAGPGKAGANRRGLPRAGKLRPGPYRLSLTATDSVGNTATKTKGFRIPS